MTTPTAEAARKRYERRVARIHRINNSRPAPRTEVIAGTTVAWSQYRAVGGPAMSDTWQGRTVDQAADASPYAAQLRELVRQFAAKASRHETIEVTWWYAPFIYITVLDPRKGDPNARDARALVSFDLINGLVMSADSGNSYGFARKGWGAFVDRIAGHRVTRYQG